MKRIVCSTENEAKMIAAAIRIGYKLGLSKHEDAEELESDLVIDVELDGGDWLVECQLYPLQRYPNQEEPIEEMTNKELALSYDEEMEE